MEKEFMGLPCSKLGVILDALAYYIKTSEYRMEHLLEEMENYQKKLDHYVVMAQLDTSMIDIRNETSLTLNLIVRKLEYFEEYLKDSECIYNELLTYLESNY
jgi:hypothetical protein